MSESAFRTAIIVVALGFSSLFCVLVVPPLFENPDILGALRSRFASTMARSSYLGRSTSGRTIAVSSSTSPGRENPRITR